MPELMKLTSFAWKPDFTNTIEEVVSEGERSSTRLTYRGTHAGELFGVPATGRRVEYAGAARFRFRDGRLAAVWVLGDVFGLFQQLRGGPAELSAAGDCGRDTGFPE